MAMMLLNIHRAHDLSGNIKIKKPMMVTCWAFA